MFIFELEAARAVDLPAVQRDGLLVTLQEERGLRDLLGQVSSVFAAGLVCQNSQKRPQNRPHSDSSI